MIADMNEQQGLKTVEMIKANGVKAEFLFTDVSLSENVEQLVKKTVDNFGRLDITVNNAGISHPENKISNIPITDYKKVVDVCLGGVFYGIKYAVPEMEKNGGGSIVNIASIAGIKG